MAVLPTPVLQWTTLTETVNLIKSPARFIGDLLQITEETLPTETIEIGTLRGERDVAPFVRSGSEGQMVGGLGQEMTTLMTPNIRIKRPFRPSELFFNRQVGSVIFPTSDQVVSALEAHIARDMQYMSNLCDNAEEWEAAMALQGVLTYSVADQEVFTATFARSSSHVITPSVKWDDATPANITAVANVLTIKQLVSEDVGLNITDAICGNAAATAFRALPELKNSILTYAGMNAGSIDLSQNFRQDGAIFIGRWMDINWWNYPRTLRIAGVATALIRTKYIEFVCATPAAQWRRYYGAIPDMATLRGRTIQVKRFAKSWEVEDPSALMALIHTRPMVYPRILDSTVSFLATT